MKKKLLLLVVASLFANSSFAALSCKIAEDLPVSASDKALVESHSIIERLHNLVDGPVAILKKEGKNCDVMERQGKGGVGYIAICKVNDKLTDAIRYTAYTGGNSEFIVASFNDLEVPISLEAEILRNGKTKYPTTVSCSEDKAPSQADIDMVKSKSLADRVVAAQKAFSLESSHGKCEILPVEDLPPYVEGQVICEGDAKTPTVSRFFRVAAGDPGKLIVRQGSKLLPSISDEARFFKTK